MESDDSERFVFNSLGIKNKHILLTENEMLFWECRVPEIVVKIEDIVYSIEVKRIVCVERKMNKTGEKHVRRRQNNLLWHWKNTVINGLSKVSQELIDRIYINEKLMLNKHILVILLPDTMSLKEINQIKKHCIYIYDNQFAEIVNTKIFFMTGPKNLFTDLRD